MQIVLISKGQITFNSPTKKAQLKKSVDSFVEASFSVILSLADYILYHNSFLHPPNYSGAFSTDDLENDRQYPQMFLTYNKLFEPWNDYLSELVLEKKVSQKEDTLFLWDFVPDEYIELLNSEIFQITDINKGNMNGGNMNEENPQTNIEEEQSESKGIQQPITSVRRMRKIGLINFAVSQNRTDFFKPKIHLIALFTGILYNENDEWVVYNALKGQYPSVNDYEQLDTVILSGSSYSVNEKVKQIEDFVQTLKKAIDINPKLKILGVCFGHQTLARMFGGVIEKKTQLTKVQKIDFDQQFMKDIPYFMSTKIDKHTFELSQYHKDYVVSIPQNFKVIAKSETCGFQSIISQNKQYLSFQFHPEYSAEYIKSYQMRLLNYQVKNMQSSYSQTGRSQQRHQQSLRQMRKIIRSFLNWEVKEQN